VVGSLPSVNPGEWLTAEGHWVQDREFGRQFRALLLKSTPPTTREGIEKYLGSGMVRGIGPIYAKKLVAKIRGKNLRRSSKILRPPRRSRGHRPGTAAPHQSRLGRAEGDPRDHGVLDRMASAPAAPVRIYKT